MATVTRTTTWVDNQVLSATALNTEFNNLLNAPSITNSDIAAGAAIAESKITFSGTGHGHSGGSDGKTVSSKFGFFVSGAPSVTTNQSWNPIVPVNQTVTTLLAYCQTAPTGSGVTILVYNITKAQNVASVTINNGSAFGSTTSITNPSLSANDVLRLDITAQGSTTPASNISVVIF